MKVDEYEEIITGKVFKATDDELQELIPFLPVVEAEKVRRWRTYSRREVYEWGTSNQTDIARWEAAINSWKESKSS